MESRKLKMELHGSKLSIVHFLFLLCFSLLFFKPVGAQSNVALQESTIPDTVRMNTGKIIITHVTDTTGKKIEMLKKLSNKKKKLEIDRFDIYQIVFGNTRKKVIYTIPDTLLMDDGKVIITHITDTIGYTVQMIKPHSRKHKKLEIDKENVFQITFGSSGKRVILYMYDTLTGNSLTVDEARRFIDGEQDAQRGYHAFGTSAAAFAVGAGAGIIGSFFALAPPFIFAGFMSYKYVKIRHHSVKNIDNVKHDGYLYGYSMVARRKRTSRALLWGAIGVGVGTIVHYIILNN